jgi:hypothetical protein
MIIAVSSLLSLSFVIMIIVVVAWTQTAASAANDLVFCFFFTRASQNLHMVVQSLFLLDYLC